MLDHRSIADQLYALYAEGRDLRRLVAIIGEAALSANDRLVLAFASHFEEEFIGQGNVDRDILSTLDLAWKLLAPLPLELLSGFRMSTWRGTTPGIDFGAMVCQMYPARGWSC